MNNKYFKKQLKPNATFEGALYRLWASRGEIGITKKQKRILTAAKQNGGRNPTFFELKKLTPLTELGTYAPLNIIIAIHSKFPELEIITREKFQTLIKDPVIKIKDEIAGEEKKIQIEKDLKEHERNFESALNYLYAINNHIGLTKNQKKILISARKGDRDKNRTFKNLKNLTKLNQSGTCAPLYVLKAIHKYQTELHQIAEGKPIIITKESLQQDTNYKYPTKTSKSIWTVRNK